MIIIRDINSAFYTKFGGKEDAQFIYDKNILNYKCQVMKA